VTLASANDTDQAREIAKLASAAIKTVSP